jgi:hypothetical protein
MGTRCLRAGEPVTAGWPGTAISPAVVRKLARPGCVPARRPPVGSRGIRGGDVGPSLQDVAHAASKSPNGAGMAVEQQGYEIRLRGAGASGSPAVEPGMTFW